MKASSIQTIRPSSRPNSSLVSARIRPRDAAYSAARGRARASCRAGAPLRPREARGPSVSKEMFSSCPVSAFVAGVKIGSGSRSASRRPSGRRIPQTCPVFRYSAQPEPARYPRATHSNGMTSHLRTITDRPASSGASAWSSSGKRDMSVSRRWFSTSENFRNQKLDSWVRILPLSGIPGERTTSKAEIRSLATRSKEWPRS